jgi:hypothetical protein
MKKKLLILTITLAMILTLALGKFWLTSKPIKISFIANTKTSIDYRVYYSHRPLTFYNDKFFEQKLPTGKHKISFSIPLPKIKSFRLAFNNDGEPVTIENLKISGLWPHKIKSYTHFTLSNIDNPIIHKNGITFTPAKNSSLTYNKKFKVINSYRIDIYLLIITLTLSFLLAYKIVPYIAKFKIEEHASRIDIVFVCCFFILLFIPMFKISQEEKDLQENRMLATYQPIFKDGKINKEYGKQFETWFNDRFNTRKKLIKLNEYIKQKLIPSRGNERVLIGKDGWFFYKMDGGLNNFANKTILYPAELEKGLLYLKKINNWAKKHHKKFYYVIAPDKNKIYGEYFRFVQKVKPDTEGIGNQFINYIHKNSDIDALYLYDTLMAHKKDGLLYWKKDTHWGEYGAYWGYQEIMRHLNKDFKISPYKISNWKMKEKNDGDLLRMYNYHPKDEKSTYYKIPKHTVSKNCTSKGVVDKIHCENPLGKGRVFVLRDSFSTNLLEYYARTFAKTDLFGRYNITKADLELIAKQYDIIILENVERLTRNIFDQTFPED